jgi:hypothetical protein
MTRIFLALFDTLALIIKLARTQADVMQDMSLAEAMRYSLLGHTGNRNDESN